MADVRLTATNPADSSVVPVACNEKGELKLEEIPDQSFDGNLQGDLTVSGSASFAGSTTNIDSSGRVLVGLPSSTSNADLVVRRTICTGDIPWTGGGGVKLAVLGDSIGNPNPAIHFAPYNNLLTANNWLGGITYGSTSGNVGAAISGYADGTWNATPGAESYPGRLVFSTTADGESGPTERMRINADGSANFKGEVVSTDDGASFVELGPTGYVSCRATSGNNVFSAGVTGVGEKITISSGGRINTADSVNGASVNSYGSGSFANNKAGFTAEGHLWCTTRRGDTVILDATSNGLASWVPYTPPNRLTELQDKWAEKNGIRPMPEESSQDEPETPQ